MFGRHVRMSLAIASGYAHLIGSGEASETGAWSVGRSVMREYHKRIHNGLQFTIDFFASSTPPVMLKHTACICLLCAVIIFLVNPG